MVSLNPPTEPISINLVVAVTGHRPDKLGGYKIPNPLYDLVLAGLDEAFEQLKPSYVLTGMAIGVDQWAAEMCLNKGIPYVAAVPFDNQDKIWPPHVKAKYHWLLSKAYARYNISPGEYEGWKMQARNKWMVDSCQQVIAVWNGTPGGTANCVGYAVEVGKPIHYVPLPPAGMEVGEFFDKMYAGTKKEEKPFDPLKKTKRIIEL